MAVIPMPNTEIRPPQVKPSKLPFMPTRIKGSGLQYNPYCDFPHPTAKHAYRRGGTQKKVAQYYVDILGYPTHLCPTCASAWRRDMATALSDIARTSPNRCPTEGD